MTPVNTLTLKVPPELDQALVEASQARGVSKSAFVRDAIEQALAGTHPRRSAAADWIAKWQGRFEALAEDDPRRTGDPRLDALYRKHVR